MFRWFKRLAGGLALGVVTLLVVFLVGMRAKSRPVLDAVRAFNKAVGNPRQMGSAGTPGAYASVIHHVGRQSGAEYQTPVGVESSDDGFVIALPYGTRVDWLQNVLASGSATIDHEGDSFRVDRPRVISIADASRHFPPREQQMMRLFGVADGVAVRRVDVTP